MLSTQLLHWSLWGLSLFAGVGAIVALFKLRIAERLLPPWEELGKIKPELAGKQEQLGQVIESVQARQQELGQLEAAVGHLRILKEWQDANPEAPARIQQMMIDLEHGKSELTAVQQKLAQEEARLNEIDQEARHLRQEKTQLAEQIPSLRDQVETLLKQKAELEETLRNLDDRKRDLQRQVNEILEQQSASQKKLDELYVQTEAIERERQAAILERDQARVARDAAKAELESANSRLESLWNEYKQLQEKLDNLASEKQRLDNKIALLARQRDSLMENCQLAKVELEKLRVQLERIEHEKQAAVSERDQARADRDAARAELTGLQKSIETLKAIAEGLKTELAKTPPLAGGDYTDLFVPASFPELRPARGSQDERQAVERARDYIRGKGLVFPERVFHAFHTSLKVSDISPLVVLAGISGTGKSELPRHYADGMGIHFLLVAVQPRWDSPQDLFGFYNYLEKRYKATELARALVQFELFNQDNWELPEDVEIDDRSNRMLLVLLDEMNLARTEYYFSELLSKLETRRMVDRDKPEDRARAEIELDMGGLLNGKSLRLYPGQNVLFVGTMNEDESTQALSDKVIDRASVLRFWRPKKTNPNIVQIQQNAPTNGLTFEHWKRWLRPITDLGPHTSDVDTWIGQLNDALDQIGRPFAFRVDRAIRSYVANYPRWVSNWHKHAMADQIEQRIFPKLRGIETDRAQSALQNVGRVIDELEDEELRAAFRKSWEDQETFLFRGVVRDE
jgi:predicted  nucleic acid-binding Zn-ribbon protein